MGLRLDVADPNPSRKPTWDTTSTTTADTKRITTCGVCKYGVYKGQAHVWSNGIDGPVGINHEACVQGGGEP